MKIIISSSILTIIVLALNISSSNAFYSQLILKPKKSSALFAGFGSKPTSTVQTYTNSDDTKCSCGSEKTYISCCKPHITNQYANSAEALIRSRYTAYSTDNVDYIIHSTSTQSSDYLAFIETPIAPQNGQKRWARSIRSSMINEYIYTRLEIDSVQETSDGITVTWRHLAIRKTDNVMYPIREVSHLEKIGDKYLYIKGDVARPAPEQMELMTKTWPAMVGLELKPFAENMDSTLSSPSASSKSKLASSSTLHKEMKGGNKLKTSGGSNAGGTMNVKKGTKKV